ncbi:uncharacterized protein LOC143024737 isoform X2 [Oratosquilla oratoria]|uniref:uncharacterized protein LOC143024737 isoform X2 n=1 Tax=Oratosquilla oratoria TaxID=337810 RepID=UPI003F769213
MHHRLTMMSIGSIGAVTQDTMLSMSPELSLGTMSTADMFDTGWDCSSGIDSGVSGGSSPSMSPSTQGAERDLFSWDDSDILQANDLLGGTLNTNLGGFLDLFTDNNDLSDCEEMTRNNVQEFLQDTSSSHSLYSDFTSSTLTSFSLPMSRETSPDRSSSPVPLRETLSCSSSSSSSSTSAQSVYFLSDPHHRSLVQEFCTKENQVSPQRPSRSSHSSHKRILSTSSSNGADALCSSSSSSPKSGYSSCSSMSPRSDASLENPSPKRLTKNKSGHKENLAALNKKKVNDILDGSIKWSELSRSDQWAVAEGLGTVIAHSLGPREQLDVLAILSPADNHRLQHQEVTIDLSSIDDVKLDIIRRYFRALEDDTRESERRDRRSSPSKGSTRKGKKQRKSSKNDSVNIQPRSKSQSRKVPAKSSAMSKHKEKSGNGSYTPSYKPPRQDKLSFNKRNSQTPTKNLENSVQVNKETKLRTRSRKEYRQLLREKRSGLFVNEEVVTLSSCRLEDSQDCSDGDDDDVDILG